MKLKYIIIVLGLMLQISCGDKTEGAQTDENKEELERSKKISAKAIENLKYNDYILSNDSKRQVEDWPKFQELSTQISYLKQADITFFTAEKDTLKVFIDSLKRSVPSDIDTRPIFARLVALETKMLKLNNDLALDNYAVANKMVSIKDLLIANSNLIYGINKKLEFDKNDVGRPE